MVSMPKSQSEMIYDLYSSGVLCFSVIELIKVHSMVPQGPSVSEAQMSWGTIQSSILGPNSSLSSAAEVGELCVCAQRMYSAIPYLVLLAVVLLCDIVGKEVLLYL